MKRIPVVVVSSALVVGALGLAVRPAAADDPAVGGAYSEIAIGQGMEVEALLRAVAASTGRAVVWDPQDKSIRGKQLVGPVSLTAKPEELFGLVRSILTFYDLVMVPVGPAGSEVHLVLDARQTQSILKLKPLPIVLDDENVAMYARQDGLFVTTTIKVRHLEDLRDARNAMQRIVTGQNIGSVQEVPAARAFIVTDFAPNVVAIYRLVRQIDVPTAASAPSDDAFEVVALKHLLAMDAAGMLQAQLAPGPATPTPPRPQQDGTQSSSVRRGDLRILPDERTNALWVAGTRALVDRVKAAVTLVDVPASTRRTDPAVIPLALLEADETASTIQRLIAAAPNAWRERPTDDVPAVVPHGSTTSIVVHGTDAGVGLVRRLVASLEETARSRRDAAKASARPVEDANPGAPEAVTRRRLDGSKVSLSVENVALQEIVESLRTSTGVKFVITPAVAVAGAIDAGVTMRVDSLPASRVLDLMLSPLDLRWHVEADTVFITDSRGR